MVVAEETVNGLMWSRKSFRAENVSEKSNWEEACCGCISPTRLPVQRWFLFLVTKQNFIAKRDSRDKNKWTVREDWCSYGEVKKTEVLYSFFWCDKPWKGKGVVNKEQKLRPSTSRIEMHLCVCRTEIWFLIPSTVMHVTSS